MLDVTPNQTAREKIVSNTLATLRIENLGPSSALISGLQGYVQGKKTVAELLDEVNAKYVARRR